jgi:uncharacterized repeat protein (TIGR03803 family)
VTLSGATLYGTTLRSGGSGDGQVFSLSETGGTPTVLASFDGTNGDEPVGELTLSGGFLYGTTYYGGANGDGEVFSLPLTGGTPNVLASFNGPNGEYPAGSLTVSGGILYGTTGGGANSNGEVFSLPVTDGSPTVLASFAGSDGNFPSAGLIISNGTLYGTTSQGGASYDPTSINSIGDGEVFSLPLTGGTPTLLTSFNGSDGEGPIGNLTLSGNALYGTTVSGPSGFGEVFSLPVTGGAPTILAEFDGSDGQYPRGDLTLSAGMLYGTTFYGGAGYVNPSEQGDGEVFSLPVTGGTPTVLASFSGSDGQWPDAGMTLSAGILYGTTSGGGANGDGEVFSLPITGGAPTVLASFTGTDGQNPVAGVTPFGNTLYGTTPSGGANGDGVVFSLPNTGGTPAILTSFNGLDGDYASGNLILAGGVLYGTTEDGGAGYVASEPGDGEVFSIPVTGGTPTVLASFNGADGAHPAAGLIADAAGNLYGTTYGGGSANNGTVFALSNTGFITDAWTGAASNQWNNPANWTSGAVPGPQDTVEIAGGSVVAPTGIDVTSLSLNGATLQLGANSGASTVCALTITNDGTLDVTNNALAIDYGTNSDPKSTILSYLNTGSNGGAWNGTGIISSTAAANTNYGVGFADGADGTDSNLTSGQIEVAYVQNGDIALQGDVNAQDFSTLTRNFGKIVTVGWEAGDFTYSGTVSAQDFSLLTSNFGQTETGEDISTPGAVIASAVTPATSLAPTMQSQPIGQANVAVNISAIKKQKPLSAVTPLAAEPVPFAGLAAPLENIDKDAKFFADQ